MKAHHEPLQTILSFEGFVNGVHSHDDVLTSSRHPPYDLSNFEERVRAELEKLRDLGVGGLVVNYGYADTYLDGEQGWERFLAGLQAAVQLGFRIWLYDEKGYPSGTAGGEVLRGHPELEAVGLKRWLVRTPEPATIVLPDPRATLYAVDGRFSDGRRERLCGPTETREVEVTDKDVVEAEVYFLAPLFEGTHAAFNLSASRRYINLLDRRAVGRFLHVTHLKYFDRIPPELRQSVEAFFTDECSLMSHAVIAAVAPVQEDAVNVDLPLYPSVPWSDEIEAEFAEEHGYALANNVASLFSGGEPRDGQVRRAFWGTVARVYTSAFADQVAGACADLGVDASGHVLAEETILQQAVFHGSLIQVLKAFQRPGVDLLTCVPENFWSQVLAQKSALSASFFGSGKGVTSETSDYGERWLGERKGAAADEIKCVLALQYLLGVRDFCFMFDPSRFDPEIYRDLCAFTTRLGTLGAGAGYRPECALYYPIEKIWEHYVPDCVDDGLGSVGLRGSDNGDIRAARLEAIDTLTTETVTRLFRANIQYVLCEPQDIRRLRELGITTLVSYEPDEPDAELQRLCREAGVEQVSVSTVEDRLSRPDAVQAGPGVVYATYDGFVFAVNTGRAASSITVPGDYHVTFPADGTSGKAASGCTELPALDCVFIEGYNKGEGKGGDDH